MLTQKEIIFNSVNGVVINLGSATRDLFSFSDLKGEREEAVNRSMEESTEEGRSLLRGAET